MWSCNSSASPAVLPERRVLLIVTPWAAADEMGRTFSGLVLGGCTSRAARPGSVRSDGRSASVAARSRLSR
jgi:hypothetical protein